MSQGDAWYQCNSVKTTVLEKVISKKSEYIIPASITEIGNGNESIYAFQLVANDEFTLAFESGSQLETIGSYAFYECIKLKSINFSNANSLKYIEFKAFSYCTSLQTLEFNANLIELRFYGAFKDCYSLHQVTFPQGSKLQLIESGAFAYTALTTIEIPENCSEVYGESFDRTPIEYFTVNSKNQRYDIFNGSLYTSGFGSLICHQKVTQFNISNKTTKILNLSFAGFPHDAIIPAHVVEFEEWAFISFNGSKLTIMSSIDTIPSRMFELDQNVQEVRFLGKVNQIQESAISGKGLKIVYFLYPFYEITENSFNFDLKKVCIAWNLPANTTSDYSSIIQPCFIGITKKCSQFPHNLSFKQYSYIHIFLLYMCK